MELIQETDRSKWMVHSNHSIRCFTEGDVERMTNNYRTSLGRGAFGEVYEGVLEDGSMVAVKRLIGSVKEQFAKELIIHREINHKNVVRLIGYCEEESALVLVMEYIANGNLNDVLHDDNRPIPLVIRLRIATECAEALAYMHSHMYTPVIHGDIKPGNILLDSNFHAKLSDFGISRVVNTDKTLYTMNVIGSIGYMDPLFSLDGRLTVKYDVYSLGAVLVELITRKKAIDENVNNVYAFSNALARGVRGVREMLDVDIASKNSFKVVEGVAKLAGQCLRMDRDKRPEMIDVAERLRLLWKSSYQDQERQRVDLFSWVRKRIPAPLSPAPAGDAYSQSSLQLENRRFTYKELEMITSNFQRVLLKEAFGTVYYGFLEDGTEVAVKLQSNSSNHGVKEFLAEVRTMSPIHHKNLVSMIGYCKDGDYMALVYEYMSEGTLKEHIAGNGRSRGFLSWRQRLRIAVESAQGLEYLHDVCNPPLIHRDVKSTSILLNAKLEAKIFNFDVTKAFNRDTTTAVVGTFGYFDPEYFLTAHPTTKSDVYSFGVVLLELITGRPAFVPDPEPTSIIQWAQQRLARGNIEGVVDPRMRGDHDVNGLWKAADVANQCTMLASAHRPTMTVVIAQLQECLQLEEARAAGAGDVNGSYYTGGGSTSDPYSVLDN